MSKPQRKPGANLSKTERVAAVRREQQRVERRRQLVIGGIVLGVIAAVIGVGFLLASLTKDVEDDAPQAATSDYGLTIGSEDASADVVIYEDFLCPACQAVEAQISERLDALAEEGEALVEYRPFAFLTQFGDYTERAVNAFAVVLDASGPEVAKEFHDELFANQPPESGPFPDDDWLVELAVTAGAEEDAVRGPIEDLEQQSWVTEATQEAKDAGVQSTPTILVNGKQVEGNTLDELVTNLFAEIDAS